MQVLHESALGQLLLNFFPVLVRKFLKHRPPCKRIFFGGFRNSFVSLSRQRFKHSHLYATAKSAARSFVRLLSGYKISQTTRDQHKTTKTSRCVCV